MSDKNPYYSFPKALFEPRDVVDILPTRMPIVSEFRFARANASGDDQPAELHRFNVTGPLVTTIQLSDEEYSYLEQRHDALVAWFQDRIAEAYAAALLGVTKGEYHEHFESPRTYLRASVCIPRGTDLGVHSARSD